jgi:ribA/ribD-fused uncharacterized protein
MTVIIHFYRVSDAFGEFSNFALYPIELDGEVWPTSEHYFQAMKFKDKHHQEMIRAANSPMEAARMGRDRRRPMRGDWEVVEDQVMFDAVLAKFTQYEELRQLLLSTGDANIIEHTERDRYWGDGGDGRGKNRLGQILMQVRQSLREQETR